MTSAVQAVSAVFCDFSLTLITLAARESPSRSLRSHSANNYAPHRPKDRDSRHQVMEATPLRACVEFR